MLNLVASTSRAAVLDVIAGMKASEVSILAAEVSQIPKYGVWTGVSRYQHVPSAGSLREISSAVKLVFHLQKYGNGSIRVEQNKGKGDP